MFELPDLLHLFRDNDLSLFLSAVHCRRFWLIKKMLELSPAIINQGQHHVSGPPLVYALKCGYTDSFFFDWMIGREGLNLDAADNEGYSLLHMIFLFFYKDKHLYKKLSRKVLSMG